MYLKKEMMLNGTKLSIETGKMAKQANGSCVITYGGTSILVNAVMSKEEKPDIDFLPLSVDYREKSYAAGKIPGGVFKREAKATTKEILSARICDRTIRPLFPDNLKRELSVVNWVISADKENDPDIWSVLGASVALNLSDIPFEGLVAGGRVAKVDGEFVFCPTFEQLERSSLELVMSGSEDSIAMVEGGANIISEEEMIEALKFGHEQIKKVLEFQKEFLSNFTVEKQEISTLEEKDEIKDLIFDMGYEKTKEIILKKLDKKGLEKELHELHSQIKEAVLEKYPDDEFYYHRYIKKLEKKAIRELIFKQNFRPDGRKTDEIRPITCEVGLLERPHGSALFTRGQTQSLATTTLGAKEDEMMGIYLEGNSYSRYFLHYNFPGFCTGEVKPDRGPGRREIGHGHLAERSLIPVLPSEEEFPYTMRVVSDILESNGSSSMASVCGGSLSLMDAGVPIKEHVAGIAMGLMHEDETGDYAILTDIQGIEDHLGEMDFKITGTKDGITAFQMDIKIKGLSFEIMTEALEQAKKARLFILDKMNETISAPKELSEYAPIVEQIEIPDEKVRFVFGPGGKTIKNIQAVSETSISVENGDKVASVKITGYGRASIQKALDMINAEIAEPELNKIYTGKIVKVLDFGAVAEFLNGRASGLIHVSELSDTFVKDVTKVVKEGQEVTFKVIEIDKKRNRVSLSVKQAIKKDSEQNSSNEQ